MTNEQNDHPDRAEQITRVTGAFTAADGCGLIHPDGRRPASSDEYDSAEEYQAALAVWRSRADRDAARLGDLLPAKTRDRGEWDFEIIVRAERVDR